MTRTIVDGLCQLSASLAAKGCDRGEIVITLPDVAYDALEAECDPSRELRHELVISCSHGTMFKVRRQLIPPSIEDDDAKVKGAYAQAMDQKLENIKNTFALMYGALSTAPPAPAPIPEPMRVGSTDVCVECHIKAGISPQDIACTCDRFFLELAEKAGTEIRASDMDAVKLEAVFGKPVIAKLVECRECGAFGCTINHRSFT